jgi:tetratricopeptide (TPR) repeat protein
MQIYHYLERIEELLEVLEAATIRYPTDISIISFAGFLSMEYSSHEKAIEWFKTGLKVCTNDQERSELWGYIGDVYHDMGNDKRAFKAYRKALNYNPENVLVLNNYAYFLSLLERDLEHALIMSKKAVDLESNNASYVDTYAWILHCLGRNDEAKKIMTTAL